jgi:hypothetical protein
MWEHGLPTMMRVHKQDTTEGLVAVLLEQLRTTLDRFFSIEVGLCTLNQVDP